MTVTPLMAFREKAARGEVRLLTPDTKTKPWSRQEMSETEISRLCRQAKQADVILYFGGEESILSGEARCRAHLDLPGNQTEQLRALKATGKPVVLVIMAGRPLCIGQELEIADAVLYSFHGGTMAGPALARLLMGEAAPSGRLPVTFPQAEGQIPIYYNKKNTGRPTDHPVLIDQIPVGAPQFSLGESSYWLEYGDKPLLPFGYGLTYTTFAYGAPVLSDTLITDEMTVSCVIRNTGERDRNCMCATLWAALHAPCANSKGSNASAYPQAIALPLFSPLPATTWRTGTMRRVSPSARTAAMNALPSPGASKCG